jgi:hypothetical protein
MATKRSADTLHEHGASATSTLGTGQVKQRHGPGSVLDQGADRRLVAGVVDQLTLSASRVRGALRIRQLDTVGAALAWVMLCGGRFTLNSQHKSLWPVAQSRPIDARGDEELVCARRTSVLFGCGAM